MGNGSTPSGRRIFFGWLLLPILWFIYLAAAGLPMFGGSVANAYLADDLKLSRATLGEGMFFYAICNGITAPLVAFVLNRLGLRFALSAGCALLTVAALGMVFVVNDAFTFLAAFGILMGLGGSLGGFIPTQAGATIWFERHRSLAIAIILTGSAIGGFIAPPLLNELIGSADGDWRVGWLAMGVVFFVGTLLALLVKNRPEDIGQTRDGGPPSAAPERADSPERRAARVYRSGVDFSATQTLRTPAFWLVGLAAMLCTSPLTALLAHGVLHFKHVGFTPETAAMSVSVLAITSLFSRLAGGYLADRMEPRYPWAIAMVVYAAGLAIAIEPGAIGSVYVYAALAGTGIGIYLVCQAAMIGNYFGAGAFATVMGMVVPLTTIAASISPVVMGYLFDAQGDYRTALTGLTAIAIGSAVLVLAIKPPAVPAD